ncbi:capsular biosynthesis protein [Pseudoalteromonas xiamenensis]|uniref:Capsular biosynthesis protein n=1 Tax=Pseudoalteromonas xiamenensis TaxID=882626 RepID=A0A975DIM5_9GAMM|nr:capsular biosynthesis protein [Pseudoalteromonas xiamenensis]QTH72553.1 capsular biosynthesis protein [Pseudoalteromonas xiamenensis]
MFLIMSAAYVGPEIQSEFGKIPPSFLPLGNRRLFQHQVNLAPQGVKVCLSVPESYLISKIDMKWLDNHGIDVVRAPDGLSLGASLVASLNLSDHPLDTPLHVLFGDTLFTELPVGDDIISVSEVTDSYNWAIVTNDSMQWLKDCDNRLDPDSHSGVVSGYFKFSSPRQLIKSITQSNWQFLEGLNKYHDRVGLTSVFSDDWLDFGHVNTYYRSKASYTTQRVFNDLKITADWVEKSSFKNRKIAAEANWFLNLPLTLRSYIPQFLGSTQNDDRVSYRLEYLHQTSLSELYVFSELPATIWEQILIGTVKFLKSCLQESASKNEPVNRLNDLLGEKTTQRLLCYCQEHNINIEDEWYFNNEPPVSLKTILERSQKHLPIINDDWPISVLHGDFCFSNILYDFRTNRIKTIDPRGLTTNGELTIYGDIRYDIAKLGHSILGMYDWIIAGYFDIKLENRNIQFQIDVPSQHKLIQKHFVKLVVEEFGLTDVSLMAMQIQLFLSMLPLHSDDNNRQKALFANAFRIYNIMKRL